MLTGAATRVGCRCIPTVLSLLPSIISCKIYFFENLLVWECPKWGRFTLIHG